MMWFFWLPLFFVVPFFVIMLVRHGAGPGCGMHYGHGMYPTSVVPPQGPAGNDPVEIVRQRLARGEITPEQYNEIRRVLG